MASRNQTNSKQKSLRQNKSLCRPHTPCYELETEDNMTADLARPPPDLETKIQRTCSRLVGREILSNVSPFVHHFLNCPEALVGSGYDWEEDVLPLGSQYDWRSAWEESGASIVTDSFGEAYALCAADFETLQTVGADRDENIHRLGALVVSTYNGESDRHEPDDYREACEACGIDDPHVHEAYEHWVVTDWFASRLREHGEIVGELFGLTIWGRCATGQAIMLDGVVREIAYGMEILPGQRHEWTD